MLGPDTGATVGPDSAEWHLMVAATAPSPVVDLRPLVSRVHDWQRFIELLQAHRVEAVAACQLTRLADDVIPAEARRALEGARRKSARQSLRLAGELIRLLDDFAVAGIRVLPFKGTTLALAAYGDLGLRRAGDIDLLLAPEDLARADARVVELGYRRLAPRFAPLGDAGDIVLASRHDIEYFHPLRRIRIELHWRWLRNPAWLPLDFDDLYRRAGRVEFQGRSLPWVPSEELFLYLCAHGAHHRWKRFMWLNDLRHLISAKTYAPDPVRLRILARRGHGERALDWSLRFLTAVSGVPVHTVDAGANDPVVPGIERAWREALTRHAEGSAADTSVREFLDEWRLLPSARARWQGLILPRLFGPSENDVATLSLPRRWQWLYPLLRPGLWLWRRWFPASTTPAG